MILASIKRSLAAADLACSTAPFPLFPSRLGDFINPTAPFYRSSSCFTQGTSVMLAQPPSLVNPVPSNSTGKEVSSTVLKFGCFPFFLHCKINDGVFYYF